MADTKKITQWSKDNAYQTTRDQLLHANENFRSELYFDHRGIPTIGDGWALVVSVKGNWVVDTGKIAVLTGGDKTPAFAALKEAFQPAADILNTTKGDEPVYGAKRTLTAFQDSTRGILTELWYGELDSKWRPSEWNFRPETAEMERLRNSVVGERERQS